MHIELPLSSAELMATICRRYPCAAVSLYQHKQALLSNLSRPPYMVECAGFHSPAVHLRGSLLAGLLSLLMVTPKAPR
jgi:hypothetical protein